MKTEYYWLKEQERHSPDLDTTLSQILQNFKAPRYYHESLPNYQASPLCILKSLANELGLREIYVKNEGERFGIAAVKMLGASWAMHLLCKDNPGLKGFCTATDGNHGRSVAWSAQYLGKDACIFVPAYTVPSRIAAIESEQAKVIRVDGNYDQAVREAKIYAQESGYTLVQDMAWEDYEAIPALITAGYYTQMSELEKQLVAVDDSVDWVFLQSGNGTWPSAICHYLRNHPRFEKTGVLLVEPVASDGMLESLKKGMCSSTRNAQKTIMAGLNCGTPSSLAFTLLHSQLDGAMAIEDRYAEMAMKTFYVPFGDDPQIKAGESGAAGLGGLLALLIDPGFQALKEALGIDKTSRVLVFNTEGVTDPEFFRSVVG